MAVKTRGKLKKPQPELPKMPEPNSMGQLARGLISARIAFSEAQDKRKDYEDALAKEMIEKKKHSFTVDGYTFKLEHIDAKDRIKVNTDGQRND